MANNNNNPNIFVAWYVHFSNSEYKRLTSEATCRKFQKSSTKELSTIKHQFSVYREYSVYRELYCSLKAYTMLGNCRLCSINFSSNWHIKHSTAVLLCGIVLKYYFLSEGVTYHYLALSKWFVSEVYAEPFLFIYISISVFGPWSLLTSQKSTEHHLLLMMLQASTTRYIQHNYTPMQAIGVLSHEGFYKSCSY